MSMHVAEQFRQSVNADPALQAAVRQCMAPGGTVDMAAVAALGGRSGYAFSAEDAEQIFADEGCELSDFELEMVSAGTPTSCNGGSSGNA